MKRSMQLAAALLLTPVSALAAGQVSYEEVPVIETIPLIRTVEISTPRDYCHEEEVVVEHRDHDYGSRTPVVISTIIGGAIGNAVGHGKSNRRVGTVVGAVLGHSIGRDIIRDRPSGVTREYQLVERCETVYESHTEERVTGYQVTYEYNGQVRSIRMDRDPGETIRLRVSVDPVL